MIFHLKTFPIAWKEFDFARFSKDKTLFDFQKNALKNALSGLWLYFKDKNADKQSLFITIKRPLHNG